MTFSKLGEKPTVSPIVKKAYELALKARLNSYSPYSKFKVGAALKLKDSDEIITGFNIENSSYGGTICAERSALYSAVTQNLTKKFEFIVVVTDTNPAAVPCGICLQALSEFCQGDFPIYLANLEGIDRVLPFKEFLPHPFDSLNDSLTEDDQKDNQGKK